MVLIHVFNTDCIFVYSCEGESTTVVRFFIEMLCCFDPNTDWPAKYLEPSNPFATKLCLLNSVFLCVNLNEKVMRMLITG